MKNVLSSMQKLKSSDVCNKFSKSVSYETLVGGTATTGRGIKQTQRLFLSSANTPLTAVGTLTSLLCNSAKVMEKFFKKNFRDDSFCFVASPKDSLHRHSEPKAKNPKNNIKCWILRFANASLRMTFPVLALIFNLATTAESRAECAAKTNKWTTRLDCYTAWNPGAPDNCGDGCTYSYNNGKLTVTATKPGAIIPEGMFAPSYYDEKADFPNITNIEIAGEFDNIKPHAFLYTNANISGKDGILYLKNVDYNAVQGNTLTGTIIVNDKTKEIVGQWYAANLDATIILPPSIQAIGVWAPLGLNLGENAKIYCGAENCEELFRNVDCDAIGEQYSTRCKNNLKTLLASGKLLAYPDGCTKMGVSGCTKCKNENFRLNDGECDRLRYTPAEAAEVLTNDNNNSVTITFKK